MAIPAVTAEPTPLPAPLEGLFARGEIQGGVLEFYSETAFLGRIEPPDDALAAALDMLYTAPEADRALTGIAEADAVQSLTLNAGVRSLVCLVPFYSDYALISIYEGNMRLDLALAVPGLRELLEPYASDALVPYTCAYTTEPLGLDPVLRAMVDASRIPAITQEVPFTRMSYAPSEKSVMRILSPEDAEIALDEDALLIVAALGEKGTGGWEVEIIKIETTPPAGEDAAEQALARVTLRVTEPMEGDWVSVQGVSPVDAVVVAADRIPSDSIVMFEDEKGTLMGILAW